MSDNEYVYGAHASPLAYEQSRTAIEDACLADARMILEQQGRKAGEHRFVWVDDTVLDRNTGSVVPVKCLFTVVQITDEVTA